MAEFVDPYLDVETGILRNLVGAKTEGELKMIEADVVAAEKMDYTLLRKMFDKIVKAKDE